MCRVTAQGVKVTFPVVFTCSIDLQSTHALAAMNSGVAYQTVALVQSKYKGHSQNRNHAPTAVNKVLIREVCIAVVAICSCGNYRQVLSG